MTASLPPDADLTAPLPPQPLRALVIGAGAIGCLVGSKLVQAGQSVTLVGRPRFAQAVAQYGLFLTSQGVTRQIQPVRALGSLADAFPPGQGYDLAILTVKSFDTERALAELMEGVHHSGQPMPFVLSLQNGVGNEESVAQAVGAARTLAGTITAPVEVPGPNQIVLTKPTFTLGLALWQEDAPDSAHRLLAQLSQILGMDGVRVTLYPDARAMKWSKLLMNQIGNVTSAILAASPAQIFAHPGLANLEIDALRESMAVMKAAGIRPINVGKYPLGTAAPLLRHAPRWLLRWVLGRIVGGARGGKMPSLFLDLDRGRDQSEIHWYNGAVVRQAEILGVPVPTHQTLTQIMEQLLAAPEERSGWQSAFDRLVAAVYQAQRAARSPS